MRHASSHRSTTLVLLTFWILVLATTASSYHNHTQNALRNSTRPYSVLMAESIVKRGQGMGHNQDNEPYISYEHGTFQHALWDLYTHTHNKTYLSWIKKGIDNIINREGSVIGGYDLNKYILDDIRVGESIINLYKATKEEKYKIAAGVLHGQIKLQPRTAEGGLWSATNLNSPLHLRLTKLGIKNATHTNNGWMVSTWPFPSMPCMPQPSNPTPQKPSSRI
jgi:hypothetical protein